MHRKRVAPSDSLPPSPRASPGRAGGCYRNLIPAPNWTPSHILQGGHKVTTVACSAGPAPHSSASPAARMLPSLPHSLRPALPARLPPSSLSPETTFRVTRGDECCWRSNDGATNCLRHKIQHAFLNHPSSSACLTDRGGSAGEADAWIPVGWLRNFRNRVKFWRHNSDFTISQF